MSSPALRVKPEIVPMTEDGLTIFPTVLRSWEVKRDRTLILKAEVDGDLLSVTNAAGQTVRLSTEQADAWELVLKAWQRVR